MFSGLFRKFEKNYNTKIDGRGLAVFRIVFSVIFLIEIIQLFAFRHLVFDKVPYLVPSEIDFTPLFFFWIIVILFIIFGFLTRFAAIVNYIITIGILGAIGSYEYHMFYVYQAVSFLFIFLPVSQNISIDRLLLKLKYSNTRFRYEPPVEVPKIYYFIVQLVGIAFVYFDSMFFKTASHIWMNGMGLWLPASMPQVVYMNISPLLNAKILILGLGYLTLVFEGIFLFTFWRKKWRLPLFIIGIGLHLGILVCFPIPLFAIGVCAIYLLMVPVSFWKTILGRKETNAKYLRFYYDAECPLCNRTRIVITHFDVRNRIEFLPVQAYASSVPQLKDIPMNDLLDDIYSIDKKGNVYSGLDTYIRVFKSIWYLKPLSWILSIPGIYHLGKRVYKYVANNRTTERCTEDNCGYVPPVLPLDESKVKILTNLTLKDIKLKLLFTCFVFICVSQVIVTYNSLLIVNFWKAINMENAKVSRYSLGFAQNYQKVTKTFFGITHHAVFMDSHFERFNHTVAVYYQNPDGHETLLPMISEPGTPGPYLSGFLWVKWTFRVVGKDVDQQKLETGIRDFTAYWAHNNNISLKNATFLIKVKKNRVPDHWEYDFLNTQLKNPWISAGSVTWIESMYHADIRNIESL